MKKDFAALPEGPADKFNLMEPAALTHNQVTLVDKDTRSVAWSLGFPIALKRGDPDFAALLVAQSWLGQHRESSGELYNQRMPRIARPQLQGRLRVHRVFSERHVSV